MGSKIGMIATLVVIGAIIGDVLRNPAGTTAASTGVANILKPSYNAAAGYKVS